MAVPHRVAMFTVAWAALAAGGCETTAPRCAFTACGGALDGQWTIKERCPAPPAACPAARVDYGNSALEGTFTFSGGASYAASLRQRGTITVTVPLSCYPEASGCAALEAELRAAAASRLASVSCSGAATCTCREALREDPITETGTYRIAESRVILTSGGNATTDDYCVSGNLLKLQPAPPPGSTATAAPEVLVLSR
jgi:hypothetical protein